MSYGISTTVNKTFDETCLMSFCRITENCIESIMGTECRITFLFLRMGTEPIFYSHFSIVEDNSGRDTS